MMELMMMCVRAVQIDQSGEGTTWLEISSVWLIGMTRGACGRHCMVWAVRGDIDAVVGPVPVPVPVVGRW